MIELYTHGNRLIVQEVCNFLSNRFKLRLAEAGEFTKRAFMNNKLNLIQVEALQDLMSSETMEQKKQALSSLHQHYLIFEQWNKNINQCIAYLTAYMDFGDDNEDAQNLDKLWNLMVIPILQEQCIESMQQILLQNQQSMQRGILIREGIKIVLLGAPNAGKSSLMNRIAGSDVSIVSEMEGTTRDVIEIKMNIHGYLINLFDTAGLRSDPTNKVEEEGMRRSLKKLQESHIVIYMLDMQELVDKKQDASLQTVAEQQPIFSQFLKPYLKDKKVFYVWNKMDLLQDKSNQKNEFQDHLQISCKENQGIDSLMNTMQQYIQHEFFSKQPEQETESSQVVANIITRQRHVDCINNCLDNLIQAKRYLEVGKETNSSMPDLALEHLRLASSYMGLLLGNSHNSDVEDILGAVFKEFCIGK